MAAIRRLLGAPGWHTALVVTHGGVNRPILVGVGGRPRQMRSRTRAASTLDFDLGEDGTVLRTMIKTVNLTPYNCMKHDEPDVVGSAVGAQRNEELKPTRLAFRPMPLSPCVRMAEGQRDVEYTPAQQVEEQRG